VTELVERAEKRDVITIYHGERLRDSHIACYTISEILNKITLYSIEESNIANVLVCAALSQL